MTCEIDPAGYRDVVRRRHPALICVRAGQFADYGADRFDRRACHLVNDPGELAGQCVALLVIATSPNISLIICTLTPQRW